MFRYSGNIKRLRDIVRIFVKYGFYPLVEKIHLHRVVSIFKRVRFTGKAKEKEELSLPQRLRLTFEELGPTFIKLGQLLSSRPDILPEDYIKELSKLLDEVPPVSFEEIAEEIEHEMKFPIGEIFLKFDKNPVAAASIAQVHIATLYDGREVAVKVQRPGIKDVIEKDINILYYIANLLERYLPESQLFNPKGIVDEFSRSISREMDFLHEANSIERMASQFRGEEAIFIPEVIREYTTRKVLTMERIKGIRIDDIDSLLKEDIDPREVARKVADVYLRQVLIHGFFHADPHPGNIFVFPDGSIGLCDFGIMGRLDKNLKEGLASLLIALVNMDYDAMVKLYIELGVIKEDVAVEDFREDIRDIILPYHGRSLKEINPLEVFTEIIKVGIKYRIRLPRAFMLLDKTFIVLDSLLRRLDPDFVLLEIAQPFALEIIKRRTSPERALKDILIYTQELQAYLKDYPVQIHRLLKKMVEDKFTIDFMHKGLDHFIGEMDRSSNRLTFGVIVSAFIIGSSFIMLSGEGPKLFGFSVLGIIGFGIGALLGFGLALLILRSGKF